MMLFVGERPSNKAIEMGVNWRDGRLAAKQLFDALIACGIDPQQQQYDNIFQPQQDVVCDKAVRRIKYALNKGVKIVAMGKKVLTSLNERKIDAVGIVHPAARGSIRKKERYAAHVKLVLC